MESIGTLEIIGITVFALIVMIGVWAVRLFNKLIGLRTLCEESWSGILAALKRRGDLLHNLVETAAGYMTHGSETLTKITLARGMARSARGVTEIANAEMSVTAALAGFRIAAENYPELKADKNMIAIQEELSGLEGRIEKVRRYYNATVRDFNMEMARFPANFVSAPMGFKPAAFFEADEQTPE